MPEPSLVAAIARYELRKTEHPAVMLERLLGEKHNLILDIERLREALSGMLKYFDHPKRDEWLNDMAWEEAVLICKNAHAALDATKAA